MAVTKRYSKSWTALASFWVTKDHRWIEGLAGIAGSPNDDPFNIDNTWNWEARGSVNCTGFRWGFTVSSLFRATSGTYGQLTNNFSGTGTNGQALNQGTVTMRLGPYGQFQGPVISVLNFKVAKQFHLRERFLFEPNFQFFNLLNTSAAVTTSYAAIDVRRSVEYRVAAGDTNRRNVLLLVCSLPQVWMVKQFVTQRM